MSGQAADAGALEEHQCEAVPDFGGHPATKRPAGSGHLGVLSHSERAGGAGEGETAPGERAEDLTVTQEAAGGQAEAGQPEAQVRASPVDQ